MTEFSTTATEIPASDRGAFSFDHLGGYQRIGARSGQHVIIVSIGGACEASQNETAIRSMAKGNRSWGSDRIAGALANLGHELPDQTVANVLRRRGIPPAPQRRRGTTWAKFIRAHLEVLAATDFFTTEVLRLRGLVTYYELFFIPLESRRVKIAGISVHPTSGGRNKFPRSGD
jgi:hypothetical protein